MIGINIPQHPIPKHVTVDNVPVYDMGEMIEYHEELRKEAKIYNAFKDNTKTRKCSTGYSCKCNLGLWAVFAPTKAKAQQEGSHYFQQYYSDGEYE